MSSILRALKKLEDEPVRRDVVRPLVQRSVVKGPSLAVVLRVAGILGVIGGLALIGWFALRDISRSDGIDADRPLEGSKVSVPSPRATIDQGKAAPLAAETLTQGVAPVAERRDVRPPEVPTTGSVSEPAPSPETSGQAASLSRPQENPRDGGDAAKVSEAEPRDPVAPASSQIEERKGDLRLKLQAIAWSFDPERRMAVINDRIVREGSVVDGISVNQIDPDQIIVQEGRAIWRIVFYVR